MTLRPGRGGQVRDQGLGALETRDRAEFGSVRFVQEDTR